MPELSVLIPSKRPRDDVEALERLRRQDFEDYEVIVRDDPSVTAARNEAIRRAESEKLVFLDDDSRPRPGYLSRVADVLDGEMAVAGRTVHPRDDVFAERLAGHYDFGETGKYVTRFWGCNAALRREVFDDVGPWDERMGWGHEEKELAERVRTEYPIYYDPEMVVDHPYADSLVDYWRKRYRLETQTPYYWEKTGVPTSQQWIEVLKLACNPVNYVGLSLAHAAARSGGSVCAVLGRVRGMLSKRDEAVATDHR